MVECFPGPEGGVAPPHNEPCGNALGNDVVTAGSQVQDTTSSPEPRSAMAKNGSRVAPFIRSNSDGSIGLSVSPFLITAKVHPGRIHGAGDLNSKGRQKRDFAFGGGIAIQEEHDDRKAADESDTFLSASMQLMHLNGEARQRVRQLWTSVQRLGRENQISEAGMDVLYVELGNILKGMGAEKLEATKPLKSGCLVLLASSPANDPSTISSGAAVKALFGSRPTAQLMQCTLSEDQSKLEMTPIRQEAASTSRNGGTPPNAQNRFGLPSTASLMGMISEAFQEEPATRIIRLQGCQVRRLVPKSQSNENIVEDGVTMKAKMLHRFQLLVPYKTQMSVPADGVRADVLFPTRAPVPYESFIFEVPVPALGDGVTEADLDAQAEVDDWVWALDRVCRFQLHRLEHALREAPNIDRYRETLQRHFPVSISLSWLRNRVDQPTLQRRASVNLSMIQIVKDLGRDKVLLDDQLFSATNPYENEDMESDSVSEVVKYMVKKVLEFEHDVTSQSKDPGKTASSHQPSSPAHRFAKNCEARALAFVERVLQGSSRTQSGGDIYDAISFFCQQEHVSICPVSQDARPVQMRLITDAAKGIFQVEVQVCMQFKVIELTPRSPTPAPLNEDGAAPVDPTSATPDPLADSMREWAVLEGTLSREFTLGKLAAPGTVTINYISNDS